MVGCARVTRGGDDRRRSGRSELRHGARRHGALASTTVGAGLGGTHERRRRGGGGGGALLQDGQLLLDGALLGLAVAWGVDGLAHLGGEEGLRALEQSLDVVADRALVVLAHKLEEDGGVEVGMRQ